MREHSAAFFSDVEASPDSPRPASLIAPPGSLAGSPASIARRGIIWNVRSLCSNPAVTMIWPFASDMTQASAQCFISRLLCGRRRRYALDCPVESAGERLESITHVGTRAQGKCHVALFELMRGDHARATPNAFELVRLAREYNLPFGARAACFSRVG